MGKYNKKIIILSMLSLFIILSLFLNKRIFSKNHYIVTVIFNNNKEYNNLIKEGIDLASYEKNIKINYITNYNDINVVLKENLENSDGFIIGEENKENITAIKDIKKPIIFLEEDIDIKPNLEISYINSDSFKIGEYIGDEILKNGNTREDILFLKDEKTLQTEKNMYDGFKNIINLSYNNINQVIFNKETVYNLMNDNKNKIFVTFEPFILDYICDIKSKNKQFKEKQIYGLSKGNKRIKYLEDEILKGAIVKNEFSLGYLSIDRIKKMIEKKPYNMDEVNFNILNKRNMYLKENQYLLFPFK